MEATFTLTRTDVLTFYRLLAQRLTRQARARPKLLVVNILAWIPVGFAAAAFRALYAKYPRMSEDLNEVAIAAGIGIAMVLISVLYQKRLYRRAALPNDSSLLEPQTLAATPEALEIRRPGTTSRFEWWSFVDWAEDASRLYLFLDSSHALIVPKAALAAPAEFERFRTWFKEGQQVRAQRRAP